MPARSPKSVSAARLGLVLPKGRPESRDQGRRGKVWRGRTGSLLGARALGVGFALREPRGASEGASGCRAARAPAGTSRRWGRAVASVAAGLCGTASSPRTRGSARCRSVGAALRLPVSPESRPALRWLQSIPGQPCSLRVGVVKIPQEGKLHRIGLANDGLLPNLKGNLHIDTVPIGPRMVVVGIY